MVTSSKELSKSSAKAVHQVTKETINIQIIRTPTIYVKVFSSVRQTNKDVTMASQVPPSAHLWLVAFECKNLGWTRTWSIPEDETNRIFQHPKWQNYARITRKNTEGAWVDKQF